MHRRHIGLALVLTLAYLGAACDSPTGPSGNLDDLLTLRPVELRVAFVPTHLPAGHWLTTADTMIARITLQLGPEYRDAEPQPGGIMSGTARYQGVPLWPRSEREPGIYEGIFWGTVDPRSSIIVAFVESRPGSSEAFTLALRPAEGLPSWFVGWYDAGKQDVLTRGVALVDQ